MNNKRMIMVVIFALSLGALCWSALAGETLSKSGQTTVYNAGDDGTYQVGVDVPSTRFVDNGDGTVTDNMTGLVWLQNAHNAGAVKTWTGAFAYITGLNAGTESGNCGYTDWRLPTVNELETLTNYNQSAPYSWLNSQGFTNVQSSYYWSATTSALSTGHAWHVIMYNGYVNCGLKTNDGYVWPVRGPVQ